MEVEEVLRSQGVSLDSGLTDSDVGARQKSYGKNVIAEGKRIGSVRIFLRQFSDFMIWVLIGAAILSEFMGEHRDTAVILSIVLLNGFLGFIQEFRSEHSVEALKKLSVLKATVTRDHCLENIPATELVPGDIVWFEAGQRIPADLRVISTARLTINESLLTGESSSIAKAIEVVPSETLLPERNNMAYAGTIVTYGRGRGVVVATGMRTRLGEIAALLREGGEPRTPLQIRLMRFGRLLSIGILLLSAVIFLIGVLHGEPPAVMFLTAVSLAVAAIPEALPAVVNVSLALGAMKLVGVNVLVRRLHAVETLGSITFICTDKTGTLTQNRMQADQVYAGGEFFGGLMGEVDGFPDDWLWNNLFKGLALSNDSALDSSGTVQGDPTETALYEIARKFGFDKKQLERQFPRVSEVPFSSERSLMTTLHQDMNGYTCFTKGSSEKVLANCILEATPFGSVVIRLDRINAAVHKMGESGYRVIALAFREFPDSQSPPTTGIEDGLTFLGLIGLQDPPRPEVKMALELCQSAGIHVVMVTGDHPDTALSIAGQLGILKGEDQFLTGKELSQLPMHVYEERVRKVRVYARVSPEQKVKIVQALQNLGEFVAMTGDGVNDAPALRKSNIGIAMGKGGTDVAREASHMILLDDNFASIVAAVREGRRVYDNIRKFVKYVLTCNLGEIVALLLASLSGLPIPLLPIHILWVNLVTDALPGVALSLEPGEPGIMERPPYPPAENLLSRGIWQHIVVMGFLIGGLTILGQAWAYHAGYAEWRTLTFTILTFSQMGHILCIRKSQDPLFGRFFFQNGWLLLAVLTTVLLQLAIVYWPPLNPIFETSPLTGKELGVACSIPLIIILVEETEKFLVRRGVLVRK